MDQMELRSGKILGKEDERGDSDNDPEEDVQSLLGGYAVGGQKEEVVDPKRRMDRAEPPPTTTDPSPPLPAMDISSIRYRSASVMTSAYQTSARGLPWPGIEPQTSGRFYTYITNTGFGNLLNTNVTFFV